MQLVVRWGLVSVLTAASVGGPVGTALAQGSNDAVYTAKGSPVVGTITEMSRTEVTVTVAGVARKVPVNEINRVTLADDPVELRRAREAMHEGQMEEVLEQLKNVTLGATERDVVRQDVAFHVAKANAVLALRGQGDSAEAARQMLEFARANQGSYHFYEVVELLGDLAVALGSYDNAINYYGQMTKSPWPELQLRGAVLEGRALQAKGDFAGAAAKYGLVIGSPVTAPEAEREKTFAQIGRAACLAEVGKPDEGLPLVEDIIAKSDPQDQVLFARAYNALGACHRKANRIQDAILAYLHVDILFIQDTDAHAEALYYLSSLWPQIDKQDRAVQARSQLKANYPGSAWARRQ